MRKLKYLLACLMLFCFSLANAQTKTASGKVVSSEDGEPVIGASILVKGTTKGAVTDVNGQFSFSIPSSADSLIVSYVGMKTTEVLASRNLFIKLTPDKQAIDEVIVVAYGTAKRSQFVGSASVVGGDEITSQSTSNLTNALQGTSSGVQVVNGSGQPGTSASIRIRGIGSINGGTTPLYVVDGAPYDFNLNTINPHDIKSITVLKDASSTAIYGARGANGVILITTKGGNTNEQTSINFEAKWGNSTRGVPNYKVMTDPAMYYETAYKALYNSQAYNGASAADSYAYADKYLFTQTGVGYQVYTYPAGERFIGTNFKLNPNATLGYSDGTYYYTPDSWANNVIIKNNLRQEYNLSVQGGNKKSQYFISAGYLDNPGIINGSGFKRYTVSGKIDAQAKKWLKVGLSTNFGETQTESPSYQSSWGSTGNVFYTSNLMAPIYPFYVRNSDGSIKYDDNGYQVYDTGTNTNFTRPGSAPQGNYAINLILNKNNSIRDYFSGNLYAKVSPFKGFSLTARISPDISNTRSSNLSNPFYGSTTVEGAVSISSTRLFTLNQQYLANYKTSFNELHNIEVLAGFENYYLVNQYLSGYNDHLYSPFIAELSNAFGTEATSSNVTSYTDNYATEGFVGRAQYDYGNRYFFNASFRYEGSSRFSPENRWGGFASAGAAWLITNEAFMASTSNWLDELKYKISYGTQGNDQLGSYYVYRNLYSISYNSTTKEYTKVITSVGNNDLTWEAQKLFNTGIEFTLLKSKLSGSFDFFSRVNSNMLFNEPQPASSGISSIPKNIGSVRNNGVELDLNGTILKTDHLKWTAFANATYVKSKILELPDYAKENGIQYTTSILKEGGSLNEIYLVKYAGVDKETGLSLYYVDPDNGDYSTTTDYTSAKQADLGSASVKWYGGFGSTLNVYGFDLSLQFAYQLGGLAYDGTYQELMHTGSELGRNWSIDILKAWTPTNTNTDVPRISTSSVDDIDQDNSNRFLISSNYLSLNNATLGYSLPSRFSEKLKLNNLRIYVSGDNLFLLSARQGFDPRQSQNSFGTGIGSSTSSGNYVYSQLRVVSFGVSVSL